MEIKSEPKYLDIPVTVLDFMFVGGLNDSVTLREHDRYWTTDEDSIFVEVVNVKDPSKILETIRYYKRNLIAMKVRETTMRIRDTRQIPADLAQPQDVQPEG